MATTSWTTPNSRKCRRPFSNRSANMAISRSSPLDDKDVAMKPPTDLAASFQGNQLIIQFHSEPAQPLKLAGKINIGIYDPTFYTAIEYLDDKDLVVARSAAVLRAQGRAARSRRGDRAEPEGDGRGLHERPEQRATPAWASSLRPSSSWPARRTGDRHEQDLRPHRLRAAGHFLCAVAFRRPRPCAELAGHRHQRRDRSPRPAISPG